MAHLYEALVLHSRLWGLATPLLLAPELGCDSLAAAFGYGSGSIGCPKCWALVRSRDAGDSCEEAPPSLGQGLCSPGWPQTCSSSSASASECRDDWPVSPYLAQEGTFVFVRYPHQDQASMLSLTPEVLTAFLSFQVACEFGVLRVVSQTSRTRSRDYCILYNPQWAHLPHDLSKVVSVTLGHNATHLGVLTWWALCPSGPEFSCARRSNWLRAVGRQVCWGPWSDKSCHHYWSVTDRPGQRASQE